MAIRWAVVGAQPFGVHCLPGSGPNAGGLLYPLRLAECDAALPGRPRCRPPEQPVLPQPPFRRFTEWAFATGRHELAQRCIEYHAQPGLALSVKAPAVGGNAALMALSG